MNSELYYVYKITDNITQQIYIGSTNNPERRWREHQNAAFNENASSYYYPLQCAIRKDGIKNFTFEVIDFDYSPTLIAEKENLYILMYNSTEKGFNQTTLTPRKGAK